MQNLKPGDKVTYKNGETTQKGIIKQIRDNRIYVVYGLQTAEQWDRYFDFTAAFTPQKFLTFGW